MPNRILKESICTSESIDRLSWLEEVTFYRLIVNCDDYGRMDARPPILRARLFPLKTLTDKQVQSAIESLRSAGMIDLYKVDGRSYLQIRQWALHQQIRSKKSKFPAPDSELKPDDIRCNQMISDAPVIQSESESESESNKESEESAFASAAMRSTFNEWIAYKSERRETYKPKGKQALISRLQKEVDERGEDAVIDAINYSMSHGWKGIYYPDKIAGKPNDTKRVHDELAEWMQEVNI